MKTDDEFDRIATNLNEGRHSVPEALDQGRRFARALERENDTLRGIAAKVMPCHYCGATEIAKCPHGFPGCALADDLMAADECANRECRALRAERDELDRWRRERQDVLDRARSRAHNAEQENIALRARVAELTSLLQQILDVAENSDETGYVDGVGFVDIDKLHATCRAAIDAARAKGDAT